MEDLREEIVAVGNRVEVLEEGQDQIKQAMGEVQDIIKQQEDMLNTYRDQLDDIENRDRRQNIRIREPVEIDRVHRINPLVKQNKERPRDVICKIHKYSVKEIIMRTIRDTRFIKFEETNCFIP